MDLCNEKGYLTMKYKGVEADDIAAVIVRTERTWYRRYLASKFR